MISWHEHDLGEDYGVPFQHIKIVSGKWVAKSVYRVTIPKRDRLARRYPEQAAQAYKSEAEKKLTLKNLFKADSVRHYSLYEVILKFFDNVAALEDYMRNMELGQILVTNDPKKANRKADPPIFWSQDLLDNLTHRRRFNKLLVDHCHTIQHDQRKNPERLNSVAVAADFGAMFMDVGIDFQKAVRHSAARFDNGEWPARSMFNVTNMPKALADINRRLTSYVL